MHFFCHVLCVSVAMTLAERVAVLPREFKDPHTGEIIAWHSASEAGNVLFQFAVGRLHDVDSLSEESLREGVLQAGLPLSLSRDALSLS